MKAVILCGGQGTRIREAGELLPKPLLPIGDRPILWHIMSRYAAFGVTDFVLCLGYKGWQIKEFFLRYREITSDITVSLGGRPSVTIHRHAEGVDWNVTLAETGDKAMTGDRIRAIRHYVEDDDCFHLTYGDGIADIDIRALESFHKSHGQIATVTAVRPSGRFGELRLNGDEAVEFNEKPQSADGFISGGFFVLDSTRIWQYLDDEPGLIFERDPLQRLARDRQLRAYRHLGFWQAMDTVREYQLLNELWSSGVSPWSR